MLSTNARAAAGVPDTRHSLRPPILEDAILSNASGAIVPRDGFRAWVRELPATSRSARPNDVSIHLGKCGSIRIRQLSHRVARAASRRRVTGGLDVITARRGRLGYRTLEGGAAMDRLDRFFMVLTMMSAVGAVVSIAWIMLI